MIRVLFDSEVCFLLLSSDYKHCKVKHFPSNFDFQKSPVHLIWSLCFCLSQKSMSRLQTSARLLTNTKRQDYITPTLTSLHQPLIRYRLISNSYSSLLKLYMDSTPSHVADLLASPGLICCSGRSLVLDLTVRRHVRTGDMTEPCSCRGRGT